MNIITELNHIFLSPLGKEYCSYFYTISLISLIIAIFTSLKIISQLLLKSNKNFQNIITDLALIINFLIIYFVNRLWYSMCVN